MHDLHNVTVIEVLAGIRSLVAQDRAIMLDHDKARVD
jgi:hypothetical protein